MKIDKVNAVVTGGGSGLGEGTAKYLKDKGANVFLIDVNEDNLKKVWVIVKNCESQAIISNYKITKKN